MAEVQPASRCAICVLARPGLVARSLPGSPQKFIARDQILSISINWPKNYNFALLSKLPTNYTKNYEKMQPTCVNTPRSGAFWYINTFSLLKFSCNLLVTLKTMQNYNLLASLLKLAKSGLQRLGSC